jgi:hypothetical protein
MAEPGSATSPGLCGHCRHVRWVSAARSRFVFCRRSERESRYPRYPNLPVLTCPGYEPGGTPPDRDACKT